MKTHYAEVERANESYNRDEWSTTACGLEYTESPLTNKPHDVTCKKCKKRILGLYTKLKVMESEKQKQVDKETAKYCGELGAKVEGARIVHNEKEVGLLTEAEIVKMAKKHDPEFLLNGVKKSCTSFSDGAQWAKQRSDDYYQPKIKELEEKVKEHQESDMYTKPKKSIHKEN